MLILRLSSVLVLLICRGVKTSDSAADIKKAYRKAALRHHPDKVICVLLTDNDPNHYFQSADVFSLMCVDSGCTDSCQKRK
jgi:hypothetical protein